MHILLQDVAPQSIREWVQLYKASGLESVPVAPMAEYPTDKDYYNREYGPEHFGPKSNVGLKMGMASGNRVLLDFDTAIGRAVGAADTSLNPYRRARAVFPLGLRNHRPRARRRR